MPLPPNPNLGIKFDMSGLKEIYFAGGCFWGTEAYLARVPGVCESSVGFANGSAENPSYGQVCGGGTGHAETVRLRYDPGMVSLAALAREYFSVIDPTVKDRQGGDVGNQYRTGIYFVNPGDEAVLRAVLAEEAEKYAKPLVTEILPLKCYYPAEEYHQKYLEKNPEGYCHIRF